MRLLQYDLRLSASNHDIGFAWGVRDSYVVIFYQLNPTYFPEIKIWLGQNVSEALVIRIDLAVITKEVMSPCLLGMNYDSEFKIMGRIVLFMWTQLGVKHMLQHVDLE